MLVDSVAGTTRDPVDELIELGGKTWRFVDTAGIRRRVRETQGADYFAALRTERALERAEVAVVLVDASEPLAEQDLRIISMVIDAGRALVIAYNKWDLVDADRREFAGQGDRPAAAQRQVGPAGQHVRQDRLARGPARARPGAGPGELGDAGCRPGRLNAWLSALIAATPPPVRGGKQPKIMFATQAGYQAAAFRAVHQRIPAGRATAASSSESCGRSSASPGLPCT